MSLDMKTFAITLNGADYQLRSETYMGKKHIVAPVVLMVPGVHCGSNGPILYTEEELSKFTCAWNGRPVPVFHPKEGDYFVSCNSPQIIEQNSIGQIFNANFTDGKLRGEIWIDEEQAKRISPLALSYIRNGRPLDVSTGVFTDDEYVTGVWNGEEYTAIARNLRPDHLAVLPDQNGACSWADGCGVRANQEGGIMKRTKGTKAKTHPIDMSISVNADYLQTIETARRFLDGLDVWEEDPPKLHFLESITNSELIYTVEDGMGTSSYKDKYDIQEDGTLVLEGNPQLVVKEVLYKQVNNNQENSESTGGNMNVKERVQELVGNAATKFTEKDVEWLENLTECQLEKLIPEIVANADNTSTGEENTTVNTASTLTEESGNTVSGPTSITFEKPEDFLNALPQDMRDQFSHGLKLHQAQKDKHIEIITSNSDYTKEMLADKGMDELELLAKALGKTRSVDFSGMGTPHTNAAASVEIEPLLPTDMA